MRGALLLKTRDKKLISQLQARICCLRIMITSTRLEKESNMVLEEQSTLSYWMMLTRTTFGTRLLKELVVALELLLLVEIINLIKAILIRPTSEACTAKPWI